MTVRIWRVGGGALVTVVAALASCGTDMPTQQGVSGGDGGPGAPSLAPARSAGASALAVADSTRAKARIGDLRARFALALRAPVATSFERGESGGLRAVIQAAATRRVSRPASVELPNHADGDARLADAASRVSVRFRLKDAKPAAAAVADGYVLYPGALEGADVLHRVHAEGTEDYVVFETRPAREELRYDVDVSRVPGLRLVSNTLEFLDDAGSPALRIAPPYVVDAHGARHDAKLMVTGCVVDASTAAPWGRRIPRPGADRCTVHVTWGAVAYPAMVDPPWTVTGSMATVRVNHTASVLASGKVLVTGGYDNMGVYFAGAELFDPAANGGAGAFAATGSLATGRASHTASVLASGKVVIAGGLNGTGNLAGAELFDPSAGAFTPTGSLTTARAGHTASVLASGKVLIVGGRAAGPLPNAEIFDPAAGGGAGAFTATGSLTAARAAHSASVLASGKVLVVGGMGAGSAYLPSAELFDPAAGGGVGAFAATGSLATARQSHTASVLASGKVLVAGGDKGVGGSNSSVFASAELFDPAANGGVGAFAATGAMNTARSGFTASVLASGNVLVAGGTTGSAGLASAELFDPAANAGAGAFAATASMTRVRGAHTASVLASGKVLIAGGVAGFVTETAELFELVATGAACSVPFDCASGFCVAGLCCDTACGSSCVRCDLPGKKGTCTVAASGDRGANPACAFPLACDGVSAICPTSCTSDAACVAEYYCASNGTCKASKLQGEACNPQANCKEPGCRQCTTGSCADGVCCDTACTGQCQACDVIPGTCGTVSGAPHGNRPACAERLVCSPGSATCVSALCDGDHQTRSVDGTTVDCTPYKCDSAGTCRRECSSVADCVAPAICDSSGKCVLPSDSGSASGCSVVAARGPTGATHGSGEVASLVVALALVVARRVRRRRDETLTEEAASLRVL